MNLLHTTIAAASDWLSGRVLRSMSGSQLLTIVTIHHCNSSQLLEDFFAWATQRYELVPLSDSIRSLKQKQNTKPLLAITYDDGDKTVYRNALPVHRLNKVPGTIFICPSWVDFGVSHLDNEAKRESMSWDNVCEWVAAGCSVGSHGTNHIPLSQCSLARAQFEVEGSCDRIMKEVGVVVDSFAYPWGLYTSEVRDWLSAKTEIAFALTCDEEDVFASHTGNHFPRRPLELLDGPNNYAFRRVSLMNKIRSRLNQAASARAPKPFTANRFLHERVL